ncbi:hypothetical protein AcW1_001790 [Taiwanofungus camphoratus]|nr:hypothetical protein AcV7_001644 [Antrodia cinnamomea]KAI0945612.1 hypothetical protein AcW1_001790 [Antrodia cinnamomea]
MNFNSKVCILPRYWSLSMSSASSTRSVGIPETRITAFSDQERIVLLLVGLVGSGKSTFAQALEQHVPQFRRCNQDDLGGRRSVEALARRSLRDGLSVCIDRANFDAGQRATWINIAHEFAGTPVWVIVFDTPYEVCAARLRKRTDHPTIKTPEEGLSVLARFRAQFQSPHPQEGYTRLLNLCPSDHPSPEYSRDDILAILCRVRDAPPPDTAAFPPLPSTMRSFRARGSGGFRSRGRGFSGIHEWAPYFRPRDSRPAHQGGSSYHRPDSGATAIRENDNRQSWRPLD